MVKFFPDQKNISDKKNKVAFDIKIQWNNAYGNRLSKSTDYANHLFDRAYGDIKTKYYQDKSPENMKWYALIFCPSDSIRVDYALPLEKSVLVEKSGRKIPAELDDFISHIDCKKASTKEDK